MKKYDFSRTPTTNIQRSSFDRSHNHLTTIDFSDVVPIFCDEILPGDTLKLRTSGFLRLSTPLHPCMSSMHVETFFFFVPNRILYDNFTRLMGVQDYPGASTDYLIPQLNCPTGGWPEGSFEDYIGVPTKIENASYSALYRRAHNQIGWEWFRDPNIQSYTQEQYDYFNYTGEGPDEPTYNSTFLSGIFKRGRRHDYFSSVLPSTQIGDPVTLPLSGTGTVVPNGSPTGVFDEKNWLTNQFSSGGETYEGFFRSGTSGNPTEAVIVSDEDVALGASWMPNLITEFDQTTVTINQLRQAMQLQVFYERDNRGGRRWPELLKAHFQTDLPDNQYRPLYLGGGQAHVHIHPVPTTASGDTGELGSFGTCSFSGHGFTQSFSEHGILLGYVSARAQVLYQQGMHRQFKRKDRLDFYWSSFNGIGDEAVLNSEICFTGDASDQGVFGYQERFASYRYAPSRVSGLFRSNCDAPLDAWHTADYYADQDGNPVVPVLNESWLMDPSKTNVDRIIATPDEPQLICDFYHKVNHIRPMPMHSVPAGIGRF